MVWGVKDENLGLLRVINLIIRNGLDISCFFDYEDVEVLYFII